MRYASRVRGRAAGLLLTGLVTVAAAAATGCGGVYAEETRAGTGKRGDTNGRSFDLVSNKEDGSEWIFRFRGTSLWVSYSTRKGAEDLGAINLTSKEARTLWNLIDELNLAGRRQGKRDAPEGTVMMRLRDPTDDKHELTEIYVARDKANDDEAVAAVAVYLGDLVRKYKNEEPNF
ncbi:MAG: hypothetical protein KBG28_22965 [Kofleriaceae bacterium]|nr:hypothetical protein [Kofleriaceae bacterium]MBP6837488.1 hypothetical protein [Kofleriaceae bacterium]MBP9206852.1 hypothetical protein [Kofleriaceae bacterium]